MDDCEDGLDFDEMARLEEEAMDDMQDTEQAYLEHEAAVAAGMEAQFLASSGMGSSGPEHVRPDYQYGGSSSSSAGSTSMLSRSLHTDLQDERAPTVNRSTGNDADVEVGTVCLPFADSVEPTATLATDAVEPSATSTFISVPGTGKRRRIRGKGGDPSKVMVVPEIADKSDVSQTLHEADKDFKAYVGAVTWPSHEAWLELSSSAKHSAVWDKLKGCWIKMYLATHRVAKGGKHSGGWSNVWKDGRVAWQHVNKERRQKLLREFLDSVAPPDYVMNSVASLTSSPHDITRSRVQSALYTWVTRAWLLPPAASKNCLLHEAVDVARRVGWVQKLWKDMEAFVRDRVATFEETDFAMCLEVCPQTLQDEREGLLHFHALLRHQHRAVFMPGPVGLVFRDVRPHIKAAPQLGGRREQRTWGGFFYCTVPKAGMVFQASSKMPFKNFPVQGQWVMALLQGSKISCSVARSLAVQVCSGVSRLLADIEVCEREEEKFAIAQARERALKELALKRNAFKQIAEVQDWDSQYLRTEERYMFLVLEGPSRVGKTAFARSLCPKGQEVYEVNCAAGGEPDMRGFRFSRHGLVLFDEIEAEAVASQRKLFQASTAFVQLGTSPTNIHVYSVYTHRLRLVLASNNWSASLQRLGHDDRDWVLKNSIYVQCTQPLWSSDTETLP